MDAHTKRQIAVKAECDPHSVDRYLRGDVLRGTVYARITRALHELNYDSAIQPNPSMPKAQSNLPGNKA